MAGNGVPGRANPFGFGMPAAAAAVPFVFPPGEGANNLFRIGLPPLPPPAVPNPAEQEGFNPRYPFLDPIQDWIQQHKDALRDRAVVEVDPPTSEKTRLTVTQTVVLGLLKRVTDLERQTDNMDRAIMQLRNPNARGGRTRRRRHTRVLGVH